MSKIGKSLVSAAVLGLAVAAGGAQASAAQIKNVVLVHGGFVDGSGWEGVYNILSKDGYHVTVVQNPTISLTDDVAVTHRALALQDGPAILVGHSYGGAVITESGTDPKVAALVYIAAFAPDAGESVSSLLAKPVPGYAAPPILPPVDGYLFLDRAKFASAFAADVKTAQAKFMSDSQVPWNVACLNGKITAPAWKTKPTWYLLTKNDHMIPPPAQKMMAMRANAHLTETAGSHAVYVSNPAVVAHIIEEAAKAASK